MPITTGLTITSIIALPLTLIIFGLAYRVIILRRRNRVGLGNGSSKGLAMARAAHSNAIENIPLTLLLFAMLELKGVSATILIAIGSLFIIARCLNAWGVSQKPGVTFGRYYGALFSFLIMIGLAIYNFILVLF